MKYDVIIIGGGPAGLTAAIYCLRRELKVLMIAKAIGGQAVIAHEIQNWPGIEAIGGFELMQNFEKHAKSWGLEIQSSEAIAVEKSETGLSVRTNSESYETESIILAFGLTPRDLGVPGEKELIGKGVSYCATCDGPLFKDKTVAVVGGGNSALDAAEYLSRLAKKVYLISNSCKSTADEATVGEVAKMKEVEALCGYLTTEIVGENKVTGIKMKDAETAEVKEIAVDGVFIEIGFTPKSGWLKGTVDLTERGEIKTDRIGQTSLPGVFAAGDCTDLGYKQVVIAAGEGAKAALSAYKFIAAKRGQAYLPDYGEKVK